MIWANIPLNGRKGLVEPQISNTPLHWDAQMLAFCFSGPAPMSMMLIAFMPRIFRIFQIDWKITGIL